jgi:very-short-patch-repair endonuclease
MPTFHLPYNHNLVELARQMRQNPTPAERKLWYEYLRNLPIRILRQKPIDRFIVDFYCASTKLAIEVDGEQHYTEAGLVYDEERSSILAGYEIKIIRFTNQEVINNFDGVCQQIADTLQGVSETATGYGVRTSMKSKSVNPRESP